MDEYGILINDINTVLGKWKNYYNILYNKHNIGNFDDVFYNECMENWENLEENCNILHSLNHDITEN